jgi:uncharacterized protein (DUF433 family)
VQRIAIIDRGRGPELAGTRITVYDIIPYLEKGWHPSSIALVYDLSTDEVLTLIQYIEEHKDEVMAVHQQIEERIARGNPPEVEAKIQANRPRFLARLAELRNGQDKETNGASFEPST